MGKRRDAKRDRKWKKEDRKLYEKRIPEYLSMSTPTPPPPSDTDWAAVGFIHLVPEFVPAEKKRTKKGSLTILPLERVPEPEKRKPRIALERQHPEQRYGDDDPYETSLPWYQWIGFSLILLAGVSLAVGLALLTLPGQ